MTKWRRNRVERLAVTMCNDLQDSFHPFKFHKWLRTYQKTPSQIESMFNLATWLGPHIPDDADVGVYSMSVRARVYRLAASKMPRLLLVAVPCHI